MVTLFTQFSFGKVTQEAEQKQIGGVNVPAAPRRAEVGAGLKDFSYPTGCSKCHLSISEAKVRVGNKGGGCGQEDLLVICWSSPGERSYRCQGEYINKEMNIFRRWD